MARIEVITDDITTVEADVIVNAANRELAGGGGVDGAIHRAGGPAILAECRAWVSEHGFLPTGDAMISTAGELPSRYVIHTVGPIWKDHSGEEAAELLATCYLSSLQIAKAHGCHSIAFPNISTGVYGFPKDVAAETAIAAVKEWNSRENTPEVILFVCFDEENRRIYEESLGGSAG